MKPLLKNQAPILPLTLLILTAVAGAVIAERPANACMVLPCAPPIRLFHTNSVPGDTVLVPGDTVYFRILESDPGLLSLETADGTPIPASTKTIGGDLIFAPDTALPGNLKVRLHYNEICRYGEARKAGQPNVFDFTTYDPFPYNPSPQKVAILEHGVLQLDSDYDTVFAQVGYWMPNEYGKFPHLVDVSVSVDGKAFRIEGNNGLTLNSYCPLIVDPWVKDTCGRYIAAPAGKHTVTFQASVVGFAPDPDPISITVDTSCVPRVSSGCSMGTRSTPGAALMILGLMGMIVWFSRSRKPGTRGK